MKYKNKRFIITGAPSTGKSSVIAELKARGYDCHEEIARQVIVENQENNTNVFPWVNMLEFSNEVFYRMKNMLHSIPKEKMCFLDRSIVDLIGYMRFAGKEPPLEYTEWICKARYSKKVFYMPIWKDIFENDVQRKESIEEAMEIDKNLRKAYLDLGFNLIEIPRSTINNRVDFIVDNM